MATVPRTERNGSEIPLWFVSGSAQVGGSGRGATHLHVKYPRTALIPTAAHIVMREQLVFLQVRVQSNGDKKWLDTFAASVRSIGGSSQAESEESGEGGNTTRAIPTTTRFSWMFLRDCLCLQSSR